MPDTESVDCPFLRMRNRPVLHVVQPLTPQESRVLKRVALGFTNQQIADHYCISPRTVENHIASIKRKIRARTRLDLGKHAARVGLVAMYDFVHSKEAGFLKRPAKGQA